MKPFIRFYEDEAVFRKAIDTLIDNDVNNIDIYILSYDYDYTKEIADNMNINTAGVIETGIKESVKASFEDRNAVLRKQFQDFGFNEDEATLYVTDTNEGRTALIVTNNADLEKYLD